MSGVQVAGRESLQTLLTVSPSTTDMTDSERFASDEAFPADDKTDRQFVFVFQLQCDLGLVDQVPVSYGQELRLKPLYLEEQ